MMKRVLEIKREKDVVKATILATENIGHRFAFEFSCGSEWSAELLEDNLRKNVQDYLEEIARRAYDLGWKEAKAKKRGKWNSGIRVLNVVERQP